MSGAYGLTIKQEKFRQRYRVHGNAAKAYKEAGYSTEGWSNNAIYVAAHKLLKHPKISLSLQEDQEKLAEKTNVTKAWVIEKLIAVHNSAVEGNPVLDRYGHATDRTIVNHAGANKALELLGKELGMFVERRENTNRNIAEAPDADLKAELARLQSERDKRADTVH